MRTIFFILLTLCSTLSLAGKKSFKCYEFEHFNYVSIDNSNIEEFPDYQCDDAKRFDDLLGEVRSVSPINLYGVNLFLSKRKPKKGKNDIEFNHVNMGFDKNRPEVNKHVDAIFIHEVGHSIFHQYLLKEISYFSSLYDLDRKKDSLFNTLLERNSLLSDTGKCESPECLKWNTKNSNIFSEIRKTKLEMEDWYKNNKKKEFILTRLAAPYHELFADIVAAAVLNDPEATSNALYELLKVAIPCRSMKYSSECLNDTQGDHCLYSGVREAIWNSLISPALSNGDVKNAIEAVLLIIKGEIENELDNALENDDWIYNPDLYFRSFKSKIH